MTEDHQLLHEKVDDNVNYVQKGSDFGQSGNHGQSGLQLCFQNINFAIKDKQILTNVSGIAKPGKVLAVMGPSGSGKTTLLNVLGGRVQCPNLHATLGNQPLNKRARRSISYVLQQDIFFANLTLYQTLMFAAELRLPEEMSTKKKKELVQNLLNDLDLNKCKNTIIGDNLKRGLSGGEKKRANIANELLTDPAVILLDEPTSGLDSSTAYGLTISLKKYASTSQKTVMMTIHQPSAQMFMHFDCVLLLHGGRICYYGQPADILQHFSSLGFHCDSTLYNPADFILDVVKSSSEAVDKLVTASDNCRINNPDCPATYQEVNGLDDVRVTILDDSHQSQIASCNVDETDDTKKKWPVSFVKQLNVLTKRSYIQGKPRYFSTLRFIKVIGVSLICGVCWFQIGGGGNVIPERNVVDITAALFFLLVFNIFNALFDVLMIFPSERTVINKERASGTYRLSSYYLAKTLSELPLAMIHPTISIMIFYWLAGMNGYTVATAFIGSWMVLLISALSAQSMGLAISTATMNFEQGLVVAVLMTLSFMLLGGFYVKNLPVWLQWLRYTSPILHAWNIMLHLEFDSDERVSCGEFSSYVSCEMTPANATSPSDDVITYIKHEEILTAAGADFSSWISVCCLFALFILYRLFGYIFLRAFHAPNKK